MFKCSPPPPIHQPPYSANKKKRQTPKQMIPPKKRIKLNPTFMESPPISLQYGTQVLLTASEIGLLVTPLVGSEIKTNANLPQNFYNGQTVATPGATLKLRCLRTSPPQMRHSTTFQPQPPAAQQQHFNPSNFNQQILTNIGRSRQVYQTAPQQHNHFPAFQLFHQLPPPQQQQQHSYPGYMTPQPNPSYQSPDNQLTGL